MTKVTTAKQIIATVLAPDPQESMAKQVNKMTERRILSVWDAIFFNRLINICLLGLPWLLGFRLVRIDSNAYGMYYINDLPQYITEENGSLRSLSEGYYWIRPWEKIRHKKGVDWIFSDTAQTIATVRAPDPEEIMAKKITKMMRRRLRNPDDSFYGLINFCLLGLPQLLGYRIVRIDSNTYGMYYINDVPQYITEENGALRSLSEGCYLLRPWEDIRHKKDLDWTFVNPDHMAQTRKSNPFIETTETTYTVEPNGADLPVASNTLLNIHNAPLVNLHASAGEGSHVITEGSTYSASEVGEIQRF
jgi:hypothetical protein